MIHHKRLNGAFIFSVTDNLCFHVKLFEHINKKHDFRINTFHHNRALGMQQQAVGNAGQVVGRLRIPFGIADHKFSGLLKR